MNIHLTKTETDSYIWVHKSLSVVIDNDLKLDCILQIEIFKKNNEYKFSYDFVDIDEITFKDKNIVGKFTTWRDKYNEIMQVNLDEELNKYISHYMEKYTNNVTELLNEFYSEWKLK